MADKTSSKSMLRSEMSDERRTHAERLVLMGKAEWVEIPITVEAEAGGFEERVELCLVGRMTPGQSGNMIAVLANVAIRGMDMQEAFKRDDALVFLEILDDTTITLLFSIITGKDMGWVSEHFDLPGWGLGVLEAFMGHNDFFGLIAGVKRLASRLGYSPEKMKALATAQTETETAQPAPGSDAS